jgi:DinB superfamily
MTIQEVSMSGMHDLRVRAAAMSLDAATAAFLSFLSQLPESTSESPLPGGWSPARHAWHLALTNDVFSGALIGDGPITPVAGTSDFTDVQWNFTAPPRVAAPGILLPPKDATRAEAEARLRDSSTRLRPLIESLEASRGALTVQLPWNRVSVYQMTEWAAGHTLRHLSQVGYELHRSGVHAPAVV